MPNRNVEQTTDSSVLAASRVMPGPMKIAGIALTLFLTLQLEEYAGEPVG